MDVARASVSNLGDRIELTDPGFPWTVRVRVRPGAARPEVSELTLSARGADPLTSSTLAAIPVRQIAGIAASALRGEGEAAYRMLARPRQPGPDGLREHLRHVDTVAAWARSTGRPGGAAGAVADFWDVHPRTARRWLARLRSASGRP